jgi:hypothetical protein
MSMLIWANLDSAGEGSSRLFVLPEASTTLRWFFTGTTAAEMQFQYDFTGGGSSDGVWRSPLGSMATGRWFCLALTYDRSATTNDPLMYMRDTNTDNRLVSVAVTETTTPIGTSADPSTGYCAGNNGGQTATIDGRLAYLQFWNRILTEGELNTAMLHPGRVTPGRRLFLPMLTGGEDWSGLAQNGTVTGAVVAGNPPCGLPYGLQRDGWEGAFTTPVAPSGKPWYSYAQQQ